MVEPSTSMRERSSTVTVAPMRASSWIVVVTSLRCGTLPTVTGSEPRMAPQRIGSVAFFEPEIFTSPSSGTPPRISSLSIVSAPRGFFWRQCFDRHRVNLAPHELAQRLVDELVAGDRTLAGEIFRHD